jgi:Flp pilus assembly protein TadB
VKILLKALLVAVGVVAGAVVVVVVGVVDVAVDVAVVVVPGVGVIVVVDEMYQKPRTMRIMTMIPPITIFLFIQDDVK